MSDLVYGVYDQENLDLEYDMRRRCPHFGETFAAPTMISFVGLICTGLL